MKVEASKTTAGRIRSLPHSCHSIVDKHIYHLCPGQPVGQIPGGAGRQNHFAGQCSAKVPFSLEFAQEAQKRFENFHYQLGGDHALILQS
jgi:hypothetical protein